MLPWRLGAALSWQVPAARYVWSTPCPWEMSHPARIVFEPPDDVARASDGTVLAGIEWAIEGGRHGSQVMERGSGRHVVSNPRPFGRTPAWMVQEVERYLKAAIPSKNANDFLFARVSAVTPPQGSLKPIPGVAPYRSRSWQYTRQVPLPGDQNEVLEVIIQVAGTVNDRSVQASGSGKTVGDAVSTGTRQW
jgi:hypothetical protein